MGVEDPPKSPHEAKSWEPAGLTRALPADPPAIDRALPYAPLAPNVQVEIAHANLASAFAEKLRLRIAVFDRSLDEAHEVGARLVTFGQSVVFRPTDILYSNPSLIAFRGVMEDGGPIELVQHVGQISVLLVKVARLDPSKPRRQFGLRPIDLHDGDTPEPAAP
jgi:hypothetical protein